jgi:hypothetical protein
MTRDWQDWLGILLLGAAELWVISKAVARYFRWRGGHRPASWVRSNIERGLRRLRAGVISPVGLFAYDMFESAMRGIVVSIAIGFFADLFRSYDPATKFAAAVESQLVEPLFLVSLVTLAASILLNLASDHAERRYGRLAEAIRKAALPARCEKCDGEIRNLYQCCGQRFCADCYLDHASESREGVQVDPKFAANLPFARAVSGRDTHDPPLPEATLGFLATSGQPTAARLYKFSWLQHQYEKGDPRLDEGIANLDKIEFTNCQKCDGRLRRFFECEGKIFCTDCWLDHFAEHRSVLGAKAQAR